MTRPIVVLRPEPGNAATVARLRSAGATVLSLPLFEVVPVAWQTPDPADHDALLLTSANAVRHGGAALAWLRALPVVAVGAATADAARAAGFTIAHVGDRDAGASIAAADAGGRSRLLHLGGRESTVVAGGPVARSIIVYASEARAVTPDKLRQLPGSIALLHSARAADRLAGLIDSGGIARGDIAVAAISGKVAAAAGTGWEARLIAPTPDDDALIACAMAAAGRGD